MQTDKLYIKNGEDVKVVIPTSDGSYIVVLEPDDVAFEVNASIGKQIIELLNEKV